MAEAEQTPPEPAADGNVVYLRNTKGDVVPVMGGEITDEVRAAARSAAARRRAVFEHRLAGALMRSGKLPKQLTAALGHGAANLMLAMIVQGELVPVTAKEAADVAKTAHEIARSAQGRGAGDGPLSDEDRRTMFDQADQLERALVQRAKDATNGPLLSGALAEGEDPPEEPDRWEHDEPAPGGTVPDRGESDG